MGSFCGNPYPVDSIELKAYSNYNEAIKAPTDIPTSPNIPSKTVFDVVLSNSDMINTAYHIACIIGNSIYGWTAEEEKISPCEGIAQGVSEQSNQLEKLCELLDRIQSNLGGLGR